ncbi:MAG: hypothetical protein GX826_14370, partial [Gammaproteobacteria bacterium]|nr:hypothetical protein [Gammaproteobacteria bacterium]
MNRARLLCLSPLMLLGLAGTAQATPCHVAPDGSGNGSAWATAMALHTALADTSCTEIWVRKGVYKPVVPAGNYPSNAECKISFVVRLGTRIYGGFAGTEILRNERDPEQYRSVLSVDLDNDDSVDADGIVTDAVNGNRGSNSHHVVTMDGTTGEGAITRSTVLD